MELYQDHVSWQVFYISDTEQAGSEAERYVSLTLKSMLYHFGTITWKGLTCKAHRMAPEPVTVCPEAH
jgi:hypothetical protein